jgi:hypothetical protein
LTTNNLNSRGEAEWLAIGLAQAGSTHSLSNMKRADGAGKAADRLRAVDAFCPLCFSLPLTFSLAGLKSAEKNADQLNGS